MAAELSLEEELLADLRMTRQVLEEHGHTQYRLMNADKAVCMTGAALIATEGAAFIDYIERGGNNSDAADFDFSPRSVRLLEALASYSPHYGRGRRAMKRFISRIISYNDGPVNKDQALRWVDKAIEHAEKAVAEVGRMSVEEEL
jgi:hypothetical protein